MGDRSKQDQQRDVLELWMKWWHGPGMVDVQQFSRSTEGVDPRVLRSAPVAETIAALACSICTGIMEDGERCACCGRDMSPPLGG